MKKKCTPQNNAIKIKVPVECPPLPPIPPTPVPEGCIDPITYIWNLAVNNWELDPSLTIPEYFDIILDKGSIIEGKNDKICCSDCPTGDTFPKVYVLACVETWLKWAEAVGITASGFDPEGIICCNNVSASVETYLKYKEAVDDNLDDLCCDNDFEDCLLNLSQVANWGRLLDKGIVETNTVNGNTLVCTLTNLILNAPEDSLGVASFTEVIDRLLDKGLVSYCCPCSTIIASVETFLKWAEAVGGCGSLPEPPKPA
jgi:hypothetical protein